MQRLIEGQVSYFDEKDTGLEESGRERFSVSVHEDGSRTLRAICEFDEARILRDVVYTVDSAFQPVEAYIRIINGSDIGSGWFRFTDTHAESEAMIPERGRMSQRVPITERVKAFGSHPICSDILRLSQVNRSSIGEPQHLTHCMNCSPIGKGFGEEGPELHEQDYHYVYRGEDSLDVRAGKFDCYKYDWTLKSGMKLQLWATKDDFLPVRVLSPETRHVFELVSLSVRDPKT